MNITYRRESFTSDRSLNSLLELQNTVYKGKHTFVKERFKHWYVDNPQGEAYSFSAYDGDLMIANYSCFPTKLSLKGRIADGIHSVGVVTHPNYQGLGIFRTLGNMTNECARKEGKEFVMAISNALSTPGFLKHMGFTLVSPLVVKWGWGKIVCDKSTKNVFKVYNPETLQWRLKDSKYSKKGSEVFGRHILPIGIKTFMGAIEPELLAAITLANSSNILRPLNLYIGLGADLSHGSYFKFPKFVKHSPFNFIFKDLTDDSSLPSFTKDDVMIQLIDYDVT